MSNRKKIRIFRIYFLLIVFILMVNMFFTMPFQENYLVLALIDQTGSGDWELASKVVEKNQTIGLTPLVKNIGSQLAWVNLSARVYAENPSNFNESYIELNLSEHFSPQILPPEDDGIALESTNWPTSMWTLAIPANSKYLILILYAFEDSTWKIKEWISLPIV